MGHAGNPLNAKISGAWFDAPLWLPACLPAGRLPSSVHSVTLLRTHRQLCGLGVLQHHVQLICLQGQHLVHDWLGKGGVLQPGNGRIVSGGVVEPSTCRHW